MNPVCFKPGQYMNLFVDTEKRPYIPITYNGNIIKFCIKSYDSVSSSQRLTSLYTKDKVVYLKGAFGNKYYNPSDDALICNSSTIKETTVLMFSCGTGITPFYSILSNLNTNTRYNFKLFASFRTSDEAHLTSGLSSDVDLFISMDGNRITADIITKHIVSLEDVIVLICGTTGYNNMVTEICHKYGKMYYIF